MCPMKYLQFSITAKNTITYVIIKELTEEFEGRLECIGENSEAYKRFPVSIKKEVIKVDKEGNKAVEAISYKNNIYWQYEVYGNFAIKTC